MVNKKNEANVRFKGDDSQYNRVIKRVTASTRKGLDSVKSIAKAAAAGLATLTAATISLIASFREQDKVERQLNASIDATRGGSEKLKQSILETAAALQETTTQGDEATLAIANMVLPFEKIADESVPRLLTAVADIAAASGRSAARIARSVAGALDDPNTKLLTLESTIGTVDQKTKDYIKTLVSQNKNQEAQGIILDIIERRYKGQAAALAENSGQLDQMGNEWGDLREVFGKFLNQALLPVFKWLKELFITLKNNEPAIERTVNIMLTFSRVLAGILVSAGIVGLFLKMKLALLALRSGFTLAAASAKLFWGAATLGIGTLLAFLPEIISGIKNMRGVMDNLAMLITSTFKAEFLKIKKVWLVLQDAFTKGFTSIRKAARIAGVYLYDGFQLAFDKIKTAWLTAQQILLAGFKKIADLASNIPGVSIDTSGIDAAISDIEKKIGDLDAKVYFEADTSDLDRVLDKPLDTSEIDGEIKDEQRKGQQARTLLKGNAGQFVDGAFGTDTQETLNDDPFAMEGEGGGGDVSFGGSGSLEGGDTGAGGGDIPDEASDPWGFNKKATTLETVNERLEELRKEDLEKQEKAQEKELAALEKSEEAKSKAAKDAADRAEKLRQEEADSKKAFWDDSIALMGSSNKALFNIGKAAALAQAAINIPTTFTNTLAQASKMFPPPIPQVMAVAQTAFSILKMKDIAASKPPKFALGGMVPTQRFTPSNGDTVPAMVKSGEFISTADTAEQTINDAADRKMAERASMVGGDDMSGGQMLTANIVVEVDGEAILEAIQQVEARLPQ